MGDIDEAAAADLDDLEEGECSDDEDEPQIETQEEENGMQTEEITTIDENHFLQTQISVAEEVVEGVDENVETLDNGTRERKNSSGDKERDKERKHKKHKRHRSRSRDRDKDREKKHKKHKKREREEEYDPDDEESKKRFMLKRLRALEGNMGLVRSEDEYEREETQIPEKKPPSQRVCKLYMEGRCPRETKDCIFSHDVEVPKVWELCKFYVYDRCAKRDKCLYLHNEFPCKYFHLGLECGNDADTCKFSHSPLNFKTRTLLLKHVEAAPKELLGDFPRIMRHDAITAIKKAEAIRNNWPMPEGGWVDSAGNEFDIENIMANSNAGFQGVGGNITPFMQKQMLTMMTMLKKNIEQMNEKPADLMSIKLDEDKVKAKLQNQGSLPADEGDSVLMNDSSGQLINDDNEEHNAGGDSGDETPDVTPPVSPASKLDIAQSENDEGEAPSGMDQFYPPASNEYQDSYLRRDSHQNYRDDTKDNRNQYNSGGHDTYDEMPLVPAMVSPQKSKWSPMDQGWSPNNQAWSQSPNSQPWGHSPRDQTWSQKVMERRNSCENKADEAGGSKISRLDPRKSDPRKEKRARREQEEQRAREQERLEKEKEQRMLDIDLGSVFDDLDLPPLTVSDHSPSPTAKNSYGLPFKPYEYNVASHIDASLNSHDPIAWVLRPIELDVRDYSSVRHRMTQSQVELDPRLRRFTHGGKKIVVEPPLPSHQMSPLALLSPTGSASSDKFMEMPLLNPPPLTSPASVSTPTPPKTVKMDPRLNKARART